MKKLNLLSLLLLLLNGCAIQRAVQVDKETGKILAFTQVVWFNKAAIDNLQFGKKTKSTESLLSYDKASAETQAETLKAAAEAFGVFAGTTAKTVAK